MSGEYLRLKSFEMKQAKQTVRMVRMMELEDTQHRSCWIKEEYGKTHSLGGFSSRSAQRFIV